MQFPNIDPNAFIIFGLEIKWYGVSYAVGLLISLFYSKFLSKKYKLLDENIIDDLFIWSAIGIIIGGRLGYVFFYVKDFPNYIEIIFNIRQGGMSFHGGLIGVIVANFLLSKKKQTNFLANMDIIACCAPTGIFLGRIANFINSELWGKTTTLPWGIVFPNGGDLPRHPSQIYEAILEGLILFLIMNYVYRKSSSQYGLTSCYFLIFYGFFRIFVEFYREPDSHLGYIVGDKISMGILLSIPMIVLGIILRFKLDVGFRRNNKK